MTSRRSFFRQLASGVLVASTPMVSVPKIVKPVWKTPTILWAGFSWSEIPSATITTWGADWSEFNELVEGYYHGPPTPVPLISYVKQLSGVTETRQLPVTQTATIEDAISSLI